MPFQSTCPECGETYDATVLRPIPKIPSVGWACWCVGWPMALACSLIVWALLDPKVWGLMLFFWLVLAVFAWIPSREFCAQFNPRRIPLTRRRDVLRGISPTVLIMHYVTMAAIYGPIALSVAGCGVLFGVCVLKGGRI